LELRYNLQSYEPTGDVHIWVSVLGTSDIAVLPSCEQEMEVLRREHPEVNLDHVQDYLNSFDTELHALAYKILGEYTTYTPWILKTVRGDDGTRTYEEILMNYEYNNRLNITGRIL
jgi:hypothetical protein